MTRYRIFVRRPDGACKTFAANSLTLALREIELAESRGRLIGHVGIPSSLLNTLRALGRTLGTTYPELIEV
jgi:hypothetical protein